MPFRQSIRRFSQQAIIFFFAVFAFGQTPPSDQHMDHGARKIMKSPDAAFAIKAAQGGLAEVKLGQLAAEKASSPDVKAFGQQMIDDHTKANDQLKAVAESEGMTLPTDVNGKQQAMYDRLSKLSGAQFDSAYVKDMVMDHQEDVKEFAKEALWYGREDQIVRIPDAPRDTRPPGQDQKHPTQNRQLVQIARDWPQRSYEISCRVPRTCEPERAYC